MKTEESVRLTAVGSPAFSRRFAALIEEAGFANRAKTYSPVSRSFETVTAKLLKAETDCIVVPGDLISKKLPDGLVVAAAFQEHSAHLRLVAAPGNVCPEPKNPLGLGPRAKVAVTNKGQRFQLSALSPDVMVVDRVLQPKRLATAIDNRSLDAVVVPGRSITDPSFNNLAMLELGPELVLPAPGSGSTVIITRVDGPLLEGLATLDHAEAHRCLAAEWALADSLAWPPTLACLATSETDGGIRLQGSIAGSASEARSALARVGGVAQTPEAAAKLCFFALEECVKG